MSADRGGVRRGRRRNWPWLRLRSELAAGGRGGERCADKAPLSLAGPDAGRSPSIAVENRARGTTAWWLPGLRSLFGREARGPVEGYVAEQAIAAGHIQTVCVNAPGARTVTGLARVLGKSR